MSSSLVSSIKRFCKHSKRLEKILEDTKRCFDDINEKGQAENGQRLVSADILKEEEQEIHNIAHSYPGIVVLGQNTYCKSRVVNEILSRSIFPNVDGEDNQKRCRTVRFKYGDNLCLNLELPGNYSLAEDLEAYNRNWNTIPLKDLLISDLEAIDSASSLALLEVAFNHQLLRYGCTLLVSASSVPFEEEVTRCIEDVSPILVYAFQTDSLGTSDIQALEELKQLTHFQPVCFVKVPPPVISQPEQSLLATPGGESSCGTSSHQLQDDSEKLSNNLEDKLNLNVDNSATAPDQHVSPGSGPCSVPSSTSVRRRDMSPSYSSSSSPSPSPSPTHQRQGKVIAPSLPPPQCQAVYEQLCKLGYFSATPGVRNISREVEEDYFQVDSVFVSEFDQLVPVFTTFSEQTMQRYLVNAVTVLNNIHIRCLNTFIVHAFDMARDILITPKKLDFARDKEDELYKSLLQIAVAKGDEIREMIELTVKDNRDLLIEKANEYDFIGVDFGNRGEILTPKGLKICTGQIQELVLGGLNQAVAGQLVNSVDILRDSYTGTLTRCLESLEVKELENPDNNSTTEALKQILNAAYQVEINVRSSSTFLHFLLERMKQLLMTAYRLEISLDIVCEQTFRKKMRKIVQSMPWSQAPKIDDEWKKKIATEMLYSLSATRLAKSISAQIKDRLNKSHEAFSQSLRQLEVKHCGRLDKIEEDRLKLRKVHAPRVAKVALESTSLKDIILYGMPQMGREIGRGQYGVVYSCDKWAGYSPCAIKSVVPPDDKHWNDLALEFFYTKFIPDHERIVMLKGSVIDYTYGGGTTPAVLLVMDRLQRDLYTAIKQQLDWVSRLQVSIDVVEGIRYLHSQGLVHRDIKLKNVLLDKQNRGRITDLGFCKPEAMMSYSIVGTPIHMAPELFSGHYDNSVDVFAFGILFWYICAGSVKLPQAFEQCANKDQLWNNVKKGLRPEQLAVFDDECWELMSHCWEGKPANRPLLGDVQQRLVGIFDRYRNKPGGPIKTAVEAPSRSRSPYNQQLKQRAK